MRLKNGQKLLNWGKAQPITRNINPKDAEKANPTNALIADGMSNEDGICSPCIKCKIS